LALSSLECAYSQEGHPSLRHCDADSFLLVQAHLAHYARGSRREEHKSVFWVFNHSNLSSGRSDFEPRSRIPDPLGIQILMKSNAQLWHEVQGGVPQPPPATTSSSQAMPPSFDIEAAFT